MPEGATFVAGDPETQQAFELCDEIDKLSFDVKWVNISGGPQTTEAFRADAPDVGVLQEPLHHPTYELGVAPGVAGVVAGDMRGKRIAYSLGQAQGALVLQVLHKAGLAERDVELVELPSTGDAYPNALASKQVDVAPIGGVNIKRNMAKYGKDGGATIRHGLRDDPQPLYVETKTLRDPRRRPALREYVQHWVECNV